MHVSIRRLATLCVVLVLAGAAGRTHAQSPAPGGNVALGHDLALQLCTACHVVAAQQPAPPILRDPAPSFFAITNRKGVTAAALGAFIATTHTTLKNPFAMPNPQLVGYQVDPLVQYILSLRGQPNPTPAAATPAAAPTPDPLYDRVINQSLEAAPRSLEAPK